MFDFRVCFSGQVVVRMRPANKEEEEGDQIVQKISSNSVSILDHIFTFDSVADTVSTQVNCDFGLILSFKQSVSCSF